jgi:hypothetical protein
MTDAERALTRHFVHHFLDVGFMTSDGSDGVRRALLGAMSAVITIGLFLPRLMLGKYAGIRGIPEVYVVMVIGDTLMTFGFAMLLSAFAAAFAGDSMFPDETDFRVLTPLPVSRAFVFSAKLRAVAMYLGLALVVASLALQVPYTAISGGPHADGPWVARALVNAGVSMLASLFDLEADPQEAALREQAEAIGLVQASGRPVVYRTIRTLGCRSTWLRVSRNRSAAPKTNGPFTS